MAKVLISGASGLIGSALVHALESRGHNVTKLVRRAPLTSQEMPWDPMREIAPEIVSGTDAVVHLSGENVAGLWTAEKKRRIRKSRVVSTQNLARAIAKLEKPPRSFVCASAIGYYGDRGDEILTEASSPGEEFLPEVCREWEAATEAASRAGIRVVNLRFGIVLSRDGGALKQMLLPFRFGLGGRIGSGRQWWSWIHIDDAVGAILRVIEKSNVSGAVNVVAPNPVTNAEFTRLLAGAVRRPAFFAVPAFAARLALREFADEGVLASARVVPKKLLEGGFEFRYRELGEALEELLR
ncbi:MAG TPA: TIGR01777 family oxidoreductase [Terriglobales bacterium]|nr:TIGR01777 family oxidoreductase [Terriglobales bacterium]